MTDIDARLACASSFILQSPPGEVNDVFNDVRALVDDDEALERGILPALDRYNTEQLIIADLPGGQQQLLICKTGRVPSEPSRFIDPTTSTSYHFDHLRLTATDPVPVHVDEGCEAIRIELEKAAEGYDKEHFAGTTNTGEPAKNGASKVFTVEQTTLKRPPATEPEDDQQPAVVNDDAAAKSIEDPEPQIISENVPQVVGTKDAEDGQETAGGSAGSAEVDESSTVVINTGEGVQQPFNGETGGTQETEQVAKIVEDFQEGTGDGAAPDAANEGAEKGEVHDTEMASVSAAATPAPDQEGHDTEEEPSAMQTDGDVPAGEQNASEAMAQQEGQEEPVPTPLEKKFALFFVGNKYNPSNYWTGRWRSSYALDLSSSPATLTGRIQVHVHFFEQGNVQLTTDYVPPAAALALPESVTSSASPAEIAKSVIKTIKKAEEEYQMELNDAYREMSEKTFRNLRRALPITRQKMDWAKVANYKLGKDLGGGN